MELLWSENPATTVCDIQNHWKAVSTLLAVYTVISPAGDRTSDYIMQSQNSTTEPPLHIAHKGYQIN